MWTQQIKFMYRPQLPAPPNQLTTHKNGQNGQKSTKSQMPHHVPNYKNSKKREKYLEILLINSINFENDISLSSKK
jgi:hypothetical protein